MTSTVSTTVRNALPAEAVSRFPDQVAAVEAALTERDYQLTELITATVVNQFHVRPEQVQSALTGIGMAVRPTPEPEPEAEDAGLPVSDGEEPLTAEGGPSKKGKKGKKGGKKGDRLDKIEAAVARLAELAESRLGVSVR